MSDKPPHVLFCSAVNPFRNRSGEEIRAKSIIRSLVQVGCKVTVLANTGKGASSETPAAAGLLSFQEGHLKRPKSLAILPQLFLKNPRFLASAKITAARASPDIVFLDWGHLGQYVNEF